MILLENIFLLISFIIIYTYFLFPALLGLFAHFFSVKTERKQEHGVPDLSIIVVVRNGESYITDKIMNCLSLDHPNEHLFLHILSDGSTDRTTELVKPFLDADNIKLHHFDEHIGKNAAINSILHKCSGDILLLTDVSAMVEPDAVKKLWTWFADENVGGVCGTKVFHQSNSNLNESQKAYLSYEDFLRMCESRLSSIASNEGFLYAVRRELMHPIPPGVTDDLFTAMSIVQQHRRFLYDPQVRAVLPLRAKTPGDELRRRRRIVCCSLRGIFKMRVLLNPFKYPVYSWILFSHKFLRRIMPFFLLAVFAINILLMPRNFIFFATGICQIFGYLLFAAMSLFDKHFTPARMGRAVRGWHYFCLGNVGTFLGLVDLLKGKKYTRWEPIQDPRLK